MCRPKTKRVLYSTAAAVTFATMLSGCSDLYYDRRETIALSGGDAIAANKVEQMVDPWPAHSGNTNIAANGQRKMCIRDRYMGLLKFTPRAWKDVEALLATLDALTRDRLDMTGLLQRLLRRNVTINTFGTDGQWGEIDSPGDLALYERMAKDGELMLEG